MINNKSDYIFKENHPNKSKILESIFDLFLLNEYDTIKSEE